MQMFVLKMRDLEATYCIPYINGHTLWDTKPYQERNPAFRIFLSIHQKESYLLINVEGLYQNVQAMLGNMSRERPNIIDIIIINGTIAMQHICYTERGYLSGL